MYMLFGILALVTYICMLNCSTCIWSPVLKTSSKFASVLIEISGRSHKSMSDLRRLGVLGNVGQSEGLRLLDCNHAT